MTNRRLTARGKERREQLMAEAARQFAERGYHLTSVADIVDGVGVGKGVFYWYFASKEELFVEILRDSQLSLRKAQQARIGSEPDPVRRIELGIYASMDWLSKHRPLMKITQFAATEAIFLEVLRQGQEVAIADVMRHVKEGMADGRLRDGDPLTTSHAILGVTNTLARQFIGKASGEPARSPEHIAQSACAFVLRGLLGE